MKSGVNLTRGGQKGEKVKKKKKKSESRQSKKGSEGRCCKLGQRGAKRAKGLCVIELRPPMCSSGHSFSAAAIVLRLHTWFATVHIFIGSNKS